MARDVHPVAVRDVPAAVVIQSKELLASGAFLDDAPLLPCQVGGIGHAHLRQGRNLHHGVQDGPVGAEVGIGPAVGLDICVLGSEDLTGELRGIGLDGIDVLASGVVPVVCESLGVFVGEQVAHGQMA